MSDNDNATIIEPDTADLLALSISLRASDTRVERTIDRRYRVVRDGKHVGTVDTLDLAVEMAVLR